jgi:hypothetical protein
MERLKTTVALANVEPKELCASCFKRYALLDGKIQMDLPVDPVIDLCDRCGPPVISRFQAKAVQAHKTFLEEVENWQGDIATSAELEGTHTCLLTLPNGVTIEVPVTISVEQSYVQAYNFGGTGYRKIPYGPPESATIQINPLKMYLPEEQVRILRSRKKF